MKLPAIGYFRVSTERQGASGLGLEAQRHAAEAYANAQNLEILDSYVEVESGRKCDRDRPKLAAALMQCKQTRAVLVVAKLDRLSRDVEFLAKLMKSDVQFVACDNPNATKLTITILMAVAQDEAERISSRTKAALAARRARGLPLGAEMRACRNLTKTARKVGGKRSAQIRRRRSAEYYAPICAKIREWYDDELTVETIVHLLNDRRILTRNGLAWNAGKVYHVMRQYHDKRYDRRSVT